MNSVDESKVFVESFRGALKNGAHISTTNEILNFNSSIDFDRKEGKGSSYNYFVASIISDILFAIENAAKRSGVFVDDLEILCHAYLVNPLTFLNVRGYDEEPRIDSLHLKLYIYSENDPEILLKEALKRSIIYNSIKNSIDIKFDIERTI